MAKFNEKTKGKALAAQATTNLAGGDAFVQTAELELASILLTSMVSDQYYEKSDAKLTRFRELLGKVDPEFAAKATVYARRVIGMRSITHVAAAELAPALSGKPFATDFYNAVVGRPDDVTEILAYRRNVLKRKTVSHAMEKGFKRAINSFDAYQLAKYRGEGKAVKMVDAVNVIHPDGNQKASVSRADYRAHVAAQITMAQTKTYNADVIAKLESQLAIIDAEGGETIEIRALEALSLGLLKNTQTWEAKLSAAGAQAKAEPDAEALDDLKAGAWLELLRTNKLGYFALIRNLQNILSLKVDAKKTDVSDAMSIVKLAVDQVQDANRIRRSKVFPFRLVAAYKEVEAAHGNSAGGRLVLQALAAAVEISFQNLPDLPDTLVAVDNSGSMGATVSDMSKMKMSEIGALFGVALAKRSNADLMEFGSFARYILFNLNENSLKFAADFFQLNKVGHGTNFDQIFNEAVKAGKVYKRIIIFSDMQGWAGFSNANHALQIYKQKTGANPFVYSYDLTGNGSMQFPEDRVVALAGFSEKIFDLIERLEVSPAVMVNTINELSFADFIKKR